MYKYFKGKTIPPQVHRLKASHIIQVQLYKPSCTTHTHTHTHMYTNTALPQNSHTYLHPSIIAQEWYAEVGGIGGDLERGVEGALGGRGSELDGEWSVPV